MIYKTGHLLSETTSCRAPQTWKFKWNYIESQRTHAPDTYTYSPFWWYVTSPFTNKSRRSYHGACKSWTHRMCIKWARRTNPSTRPGLDLCWPTATPSGSVPCIATPPWVLHLPDFVRFCQILFPSKPVVRAIEVSHAACKDEFRQNPRSHSWRFSIFLTYCTSCRRSRGDRILPTKRQKRNETSRIKSNQKYKTQRGREKEKKEKKINDISW